MQFCPQCKFMTYTKLNCNESPPILENYCKNCGWKGVKDISSKAIYKRNYKEDYIAEKVLSNKYTIFDVSLPRVEYDCINPECATNRAFDEDSTSSSQIYQLTILWSNLMRFLKVSVQNRQKL